MMNNNRQVSDLLYRIARYRKMGNGSMCQKLNSQLRALTAEQ